VDIKEAEIIIIRDTITGIIVATDGGHLGLIGLQVLILATFLMITQQFMSMGAPIIIATDITSVLILTAM